MLKATRDKGQNLNSQSGLSGLTAGLPVPRTAAPLHPPDTAFDPINPFLPSLETPFSLGVPPPPGLFFLVPLAVSFSSFPALQPECLVSTYPTATSASL